MENFEYRTGNFKRKMIAMEKEDCIFCKIINGEIPTDFVYQDDHLVVFKDINPLAPVHCSQKTYSEH